LREKLIGSIWYLAVLAFLCGSGVNLIKNPVAILRKYDRPVNEKHIRAIWLIAGLSFTVAIFALLEWIRYLWKSN
jgi:hypothetical protein